MTSLGPVLAQAASDRERRLITQASAASDADVASFAEHIRGKSDAWLDRYTSVLETRERRGLKQVFENDCAAGATMLLQCLRDPSLALAYWLDRDSGGEQFREVMSSSLAAANIAPVKHGFAALLAGVRALLHGVTEDDQGLGPTDLATRFASADGTPYVRHLPSELEALLARFSPDAPIPVLFKGYDRDHYKVIVEKRGDAIRTHDLLDGTTTWTAMATLEHARDLDRLGALYAPPSSK